MAGKRLALVTLFGFLALLAAAEDSGTVDKHALLELKSAITEDPLGFLSNWDPNDRDPCAWNGVSCDPFSGRVSALRLSSGGSSGCPEQDPFVKAGDFSLFFPCFGSEGDGNKNQSVKLRGKLSPAVGLLSRLRVLSLGFNGFSGMLPQELGKLRPLEVLDLGFNEFTGPIPVSLQNCTALEVINLSGNLLNGTIPSFFAAFSSAKLISLSFNMFTGPIPLALGGTNCLSLEHLHLPGNLLSGPIPPSLGSCSALRSLILSSNMLQGSIPLALGSLGMLEVLDLARNFLSGAIPAELGSCKQLKLLVLKNNYGPLLSNSALGRQDGEEDEDDFNFFEVELPDAVVKLPELRILWAPNSNLEGSLNPKWESHCKMEMLNLGQNYFTGEFPESISSCKSLYFLDLSSNNFSGLLHGNISVPCMAVFNISRNFLSGGIPEFTYGNCSEKLADLGKRDSDVFSFYASFFYRNALTSIASYLSRAEGVTVLHDFSNNLFIGPIPPLMIAPGSLSAWPFYGFWVQGNNLTGNLSSYSFAACPNLEGLVFNIGNNKITGEIPLVMGSACRSMKLLNMAGNGMTGSFPQTFVHLEGLMNLNLSRNKLQGQVPSYIGQIENLRSLSLSAGNFTGTIPRELSQLTSLEVLELSWNKFSGEIPPDLAKLEHLTVLRLDHNNLSGQIPAGFGKMTSLSVFNVSYNHLSGPIPLNPSLAKCENVQGNPKLPPCHPNSSLPWEWDQRQNTGNVSEQANNSPTESTEDSKSDNNSFSRIEIAAITSASIIFAILILLILLLFCMKRFGSKAVYGQGPERKEVVTCNGIGIELTYENVVRATGGFNIQNCIGSGGFGATYKAEIAPRVVVAVKRLSVGRFQGVQQFSAEIRTLGRVQHPNLVTLIGYHVSESEMFLIYNYLPGGNLEKFIQDRPRRTVGWGMLHKIALDIAKALAYLHDECVPRVLHRDIKPSNILLDNDFNAYLSDFGLARLLGTSETHATTDVAGTFGYVAPEYAMTCRVSDKADVYSYGVVLLELISDKKALDPSFSSYGNGFNIVAWASMLLRQGQASEFFAAGLWESGPHDDLIEVLHLGIKCTGESLSARPSMRQVAQRLKRIQPSPT
ncbi:LRR receptor-like serine/threonine-protein kinase RPK2 [Punica granatum]|uniref:non-specific serine/threonine protein kinase n=2 Tax=Punica granatum TaxID=22663 RepID=A0A218X4T3_PUNGR|nr:LRR receptor-like serine/threonine-protein kinase RPK2 [Punica granatum]OWM79706.1 hypothetical protein CDL15_Pgr023118 [Punica granatum]PKI68681.1 hypothetical protein CRG98_010961 [Punica granatum]